MTCCLFKLSFVRFSIYKYRRSDSHNQCRYIYKISMQLSRVQAWPPRLYHRKTVSLFTAYLDKMLLFRTSRDKLILVACLLLERFVAGGQVSIKIRDDCAILSDTRLSILIVFFILGLFAARFF